jgi:hypothetical protein
MQNRSIQKTTQVLLAGFSVAIFQMGCVTSAPPAESAGPVKVVDVPPSIPPTDKPLPLPQNPSNIPPGFDDPVLLHQEPPEQPAFVDAYNRVGKPRVMVFVNRTVTGDLIPVNPTGPEITVQNTQQSNGPVKVNENANTTNNNYYSTLTQNSSRSFESNGSAKYTDTTDVYLKPGQYDEAAAKSIDYELIENLISDNLSADGKVTVITPTYARGRLTDQEVAELQSGRPQMLGELAEKLQCDVLVQVTARPSAQTDQGLGIRLIAQAFNTRGGQAVGHAAVDVPPPMTKIKLNNYTRFVSRKLMDGMTQSWTTMAANAPVPAVAPVPATQPTDAFPPGAKQAPATQP